jgi:glycosyltransferase involved in cell wall biosynthesis
MPGPLISVLITCYNLGSYLDEAVESVLSQTYRDFEILIIDDGSTEPETVRLLADYVRPHTTVFTIEHRGLAAARNYLIERASGDYLCSLDADDKLHPEYFQKAIRCFEAEPSLTFVSSWVQHFGTDDFLWRRDACELPDLLAEDTVMTPALVRRDAVLAVGGFDERMPAQGDEDWDLWLTLVERGCRGRILPEALFFYRQRVGSMSRRCTAGQTHVDLVRYLVRKHRESYARHIRDVLLRKERLISELLRSNDRLEIDLWSRLRPELERRRTELAQMQRRLDEHGRVGMAQPDTMADEALANLTYEVEALRQSWSWRMTAPLRWLYEVVLPSGLRRGRG